MLEIWNRTWSNCVVSLKQLPNQTWAINNFSGLRTDDWWVESRVWRWEDEVFQQVMKFWLLLSSFSTLQSLMLNMKRLPIENATNACDVVVYWAMHQQNSVETGDSTESCQSVNKKLRNPQKWNQFKAARKRMRVEAQLIILLWCPVSYCLVTTEFLSFAYETNRKLHTKGDIKILSPCLWCPALVISFCWFYLSTRSNRQSEPSSRRRFRFGSNNIV